MGVNERRRAELTDAGLRLLARLGARGLTFRGVDAEAGVPPGTTTNYFRNRDALLGGLAARIYERLAPAPEFLAEAARRPPSLGLLGTYLLDIQRRVRDNPDLHIALLELRLEATRRPGLARILTATVNRGFESDVAFHEAAGLPGGRREIQLLHLAMGGLIVEQLTTPGALGIDDLDGTVLTLVERLLPSAS